VPGTLEGDRLTAGEGNRALVLGLGNTLLGDEGIGVHAVRYLRGEDLPAQVELLDGGTLSFALAGVLAGAGRLIVIDAAQMHAAPGCVREFVGQEMDRFLAARTGCSVHEVSLYDLLVAGHLVGDLPERRALVAVQPAYIGWSDLLTPAVERALPEVALRVRALLDAWKP
jgi:hydrogenase maturation protease